MGVDFYPCSGCGGVYCDAGEYYTCDICDENACEECGDSWMIIRRRMGQRDLRACNKCCTVNVTRREVFAELLRLYQALPGSEPGLTYRAIRERLAAGRKTRYEIWKEEEGSESDAKEEENDEKEKEKQEARESDPAEPSKQEVPESDPTEVVTVGQARPDAEGESPTKRART